MKILLTLLFVQMVSFSQPATYSREEEKMLNYVNMQYAYSLKYDSLEILDAALDSCLRFLDKYPNSFAKPGVFSYMLQMAVRKHDDKEIISSLIDSTLFYDQLPVTKFWISQLLIENEINRNKGYEFLEEIYPDLSSSYHKFKANIFFARKSIREGKSASTKMFFEKALAADSTRAEGWYEYASYLSFSEQPDELLRVKKQIQFLDKEKRLVYEDYSRNSPNIGKDFLDHQLPDLEGNNIEFQKFKGKPLIAQYFSNWCPQPQKFPVLKKISEENPQVEIILINPLESREEIKSNYLNKPEHKYLKNYPVLFIDSSFANSYHGVTQNTLFLIDETGKIILDLTNYNEDYENLLRKALSKLKTESKSK